MCPSCLRCNRRSDHVIDRYEPFSDDAGLVASRLRTVSTVLRAASSFNGLQETLLNVEDVMVFTMRAMSLMKQIEKS
jgi:hypothetical protein